MRTRVYRKDIEDGFIKLLQYRYDRLTELETFDQDIRLNNQYELSISMLKNDRAEPILLSIRAINRYDDILSHNIVIDNGKIKDGFISRYEEDVKDLNSKQFWDKLFRVTTIKHVNAIITELSLEWI